MAEQSLVTVQAVVSNVIAYLPSLLAGLVVVLLGGLAAWLTAKIVVRVLVWLRLDRVAQRLGWGGGMEKGDVRHALFDLAGTLVGGLIFLVFLDNALVIWRLTVLSRLLERIVLLVPSLLLAALILVVGWITAAAVANGARRALYEEGVERASLISRLVRAAVLVLASAMALDQLGLAPKIIAPAFLIAFGALALTFVVAVGLGSRRAVEQMWVELFARRHGGTPDERPPSDEG
jgi:Mechanosensitive ion channel, conserved TM helix